MARYKDQQHPAIRFAGYILLTILTGIPALSEAQHFPNHPQPAYKTTQEVLRQLDSLESGLYDTIAGQWHIYMKEKFMYDTTDKLTQRITYYWYTKASTCEIRKEDYTYDAHGNKTRADAYIWDTIAGQWVNDHNHEYTCDASGNTTLEISNFYHKYDSTWVKDFKNEFAYDADGNRIRYIYSVWDEDSIQWINYSMDEYLYNEIENELQSFYYDWDPVNSLWISEFKYVSEFDENGNEILGISYEWDEASTEWIIYSKDETTYDTNGNKTEYMEYYWNEISEQWLNDEKYVYTYNGYYSSQYIGYVWDETSNQWEYRRISTNYYSVHNGTVIAEKEIPNLLIYPNPADDFIVFEWDGSSGIALVEVYDMQGRKALSQSAEGSNRISVSHLKSGVYLCRIHCSNEIFVGKILIRQE